jgi:endoribonuclease LACTB2
MNIVNVGYDSTHYYVVEQRGRHLLVDTGWPGTLPKLQSVLRRKGIALRTIHYVFVTHYHPDHAGLVQELKQQGVRHLLLEEQRAAVPLLKRYMKPESGYIEIMLDDSTCIPSQESRAWLARFGISGEMLHTPGHSGDSISLVLDERIAFTGDLPLPMMVAGGAPGLVEASWNRLRALGVTRVFPGHGPPAGVTLL